MVALTTTSAFGKKVVPFTLASAITRLGICSSKANHIICQITFQSSTCDTSHNLPLPVGPIWLLRTKEPGLLESCSTLSDSPISVLRKAIPGLCMGIYNQAIRSMNWIVATIVSPAELLMNLHPKRPLLNRKIGANCTELIFNTEGSKSMRRSGLEPNQA